MESTNTSLESNQNLHSQRIMLLKILPIEALSWDSSHRKLWNRRSIVNGVVASLHISISTYNRIFRSSQAIMAGCCLAVFLGVHSIFPLISFVLSIVVTGMYHGFTVSEFYQKTMGNSTWFVGIVMALIFMIGFEVAWVQFTPYNPLLDIENYLMTKINHFYSDIMQDIREILVELYRETGWSVLGLIVKQRQESNDSLRNLLNDQGVLPVDVIELIVEFVADRELEELFRSRDLLLQRNSHESDARSVKLRKEARSMRPFQIFKMYSLEGIN